MDEGQGDQRRIIRRWRRRRCMVSSRRAPNRDV